MEDEDAEDVEVDVDNDHTLEAEQLEEGEPAATSTPRRGHLPRPLVRSGFEFFYPDLGNTKILTIFNPVLSCAFSYNYALFVI